MRYIATLICVWMAVITLAVSVGGNIFQMSVVDPVWSASPPESVRTFAASPLPERVKRFHLNPLYAIGLICLLAAPQPDPGNDDRWEAGYLAENTA